MSGNSKQNGIGATKQFYKHSRFSKKWSSVCVLPKWFFSRFSYLLNSALFEAQASECVSSVAGMIFSLGFRICWAVHFLQPKQASLFCALPKWFFALVFRNCCSVFGDGDPSLRIVYTIPCVGIIIWTVDWTLNCREVSNAEFYGLSHPINIPKYPVTPMRGRKVLCIFLK